ncbi:MAG: ribose 5-phosphate isomerase B [Pseudomonadota bacterium]
MKSPVIAIVSDHAGFELKSLLFVYLNNFAENVVDLGTDSQDSVDYNDFSDSLAKYILSGSADFGIAICGSGIGMSIALNRHKGIRAALCSEGLSASLARKHNDANILCLGARIIGIETARDCIKNFFDSVFEGGRHSRRMEKLG